MKHWLRIFHCDRAAFAVCLCLAAWCAGLHANAQNLEQNLNQLRNKMVVHGLIQGLYFSHWEGNGDFRGGMGGVIIDGVADRDVASIFIPDSLLLRGRWYNTAEIGPEAFRDLMRLERCSFNMNNILLHAFTGCENLRVIESRRPNPPNIGQHFFYYGAPDEVFEDYHFLTAAVVVPPGSEQAYRQARGWREFHTIVSHAPQPDDYDLSAIGSRIAALEQERDSLAAVKQLLRDSLAATEHGDHGITIAQTEDASEVSAMPPAPRVTQATPASGMESQSIEKLSSKILSGGFVFKSRFSPDIIFTGHPDTTALHLVVPDMVAINNRSYSVTLMWEDAFANHGHLLSLTLPAGLTNVAPGAFDGCRELRLLELRNTMPPAFRSIDEGDCPPEQVLNDELCARLVLVVPPGSEQAYREAPGWSRCARITSVRPTLPELGVTSTAERRIAIDAHLCRIAARQAHIATSLKALRKALAP
ncbi:MAG: leucine-rich repeat protein [Muribaculaceae bacterium]|nr:leucine-rich repeat protein [Muribaculaceae bacterium]